eukprot:Blabericola_migrator_1__5876@NODE_2976_length_2147_cov_90_782212_g1862_i0_p2_GENE_NODE_2976_length_2147_cov_90_782212_g1862_i0NODE_2976_length_2147_cov_90_782212_g1862_i0_p2_ORF_typecomplete_len242_score32_72DUF4205/PF13898_6/1_4e19Erythro_esteras/PF05139_14/0_048_NODE_2976_length_2147_cov_90_782212_g1862_i012882013
MRSRGISHRPLVGYLSEMEALRYCEVGNYLKYPLYPVWVCGASDHFTTFFSLDRTVSQVTAADYAAKVAEDVFNTESGDGEMVGAEQAGMLDVRYLDRLIRAAGFTADWAPIARRQVQKDSQVILRSDFIHWFVKNRDHSCLIRHMDEVNRLRLCSSSSRHFHIFHYDGQLRISEKLSVVDGPELRFLDARITDSPSQSAADSTGRILNTRWSSLDVEKYSSKDVALALATLRDTHNNISQ